ncbi:MAG: XRE family aerobic/anaerobic benzoate catabolism transcriptional regulator [Parasphingorhabdus sp.]|jgi:XRE family aerobic/anaerobic benzoate catabolism transcriptional regulator
MSISTIESAKRHPFLELVGGNVKRLRSQIGMSRKALSFAAAVSERHLANLENGQGNASALVLRQISAALNCSFQELTDVYSAESAEPQLINQLLEGRTEQQLYEIRAMLTTQVAKWESLQTHSKPIALIGLRGAGKSSLGKMLADHLHRPFIELSRSIEDAAGCDIGEIQALYGITGYRRYEHRALEQNLNKFPSAVFAAPGGLVTQNDTYSLLLSQCISIWLRADPEDHMSRVVAQGDTRPIAASQEAMSDLRAILSDREPFYSRTNYAINTSAASLQETFLKILQLLPDCQQIKSST